MLRRTPMRRRNRYTGPALVTIEIVAMRSGGLCEFPGCDRVAQDPHHRYERGFGGVGKKGPAWINDPCNILAACRHHNDWCSNQQPAEAFAMGWRLAAGELPWETPVAMDGGIFLLDNAGGKTPYPPEAS